MLDPHYKAIVKATVPLLEQGGEALTTHFYQKMLADYPEVRPLFNQAHQASGEQPRALANGMLMYARHIDQLEALGPLVGQIVNKHVALQVQPEHYPIVGRCLLAAISEVLGEAVATPAVIQAWGAAYGQLADVLIAAEASQYHANACRPGGWSGGRVFALVRREAESHQITSFYFKPCDGKAVMRAQPGQYLGLAVRLDGEEHRRNYSLSALCDGVGYRISVKRVGQGRVSTYLHDQMRVGDTLELFAPAGDFVLEPGTRPLVLISAGVGITATLPMLEAAASGHREVLFVHCARDAASQGFAGWLGQLAAEHHHVRVRVCHSAARAGDAAVAVQGRLAREHLADWLPATRDVEVYLLGPAAFMAQVRQHLLALGVDQARIHHEFFGPAQALVDAAAG